MDDIEIEKSNILLLGPTGCGKTYTMAFLSRQLALRCTDVPEIGSPTIVGEALPPVANLLNGLHAALLKGKPAAAFGSFGWSGEAVPNLTAKLTQLKYNVQEGIKVKFKPTEADLEAAKEFGKNFASLLK